MPPKSTPPAERLARDRVDFLLAQEQDAVAMSAVLALPDGRARLDALLRGTTPRSTKGPDLLALRQLVRRDPEVNRLAGPAVRRADAIYWRILERYESTIQKAAHFFHRTYAATSEPEDVLTLTRIGYYHAALRYNPDKGVLFTSMAANWGRAEVCKRRDTPAGLYIRTSDHGLIFKASTLSSLDAPAYRDDPDGNQHDRFAGPEESLDEQLDEQTQRRRLDAAMATLSETDRTLLGLRVGARSGTDLAHELGISRQQVFNRENRAKKRLLVALAKQECEQRAQRNLPPNGQPAAQAPAPITRIQRIVRYGTADCRWTVCSLPHHAKGWCRLHHARVEQLLRLPLDSDTEVVASAWVKRHGEQQQKRPRTSSVPPSDPIPHEGLPPTEVVHPETSPKEPVPQPHQEEKSPLSPVFLPPCNPVSSVLRSGSPTLAKEPPNEELNTGDTKDTGEETRSSLLAIRRASLALPRHNKGCAWPECHYRHVSKGYCHLHYPRIHLILKLPAATTPAAVVVAAWATYMEKKEAEKASLPFPPTYDAAGRRRCGWPDCLRRHAAQGYCARHYSQLFRLGWSFDIDPATTAARYEAWVESRRHTENLKVGQRRSKLMNEAMQARLTELHATGMSGRDIAKQTGLSTSTVIRFLRDRDDTPPSPVQPKEDLLMPEPAPLLPAVLPAEPNTLLDLIVQMGEARQNLLDGEDDVAKAQATLEAAVNQVRTAKATLRVLHLRMGALL